MKVRLYIGNVPRDAVKTDVSRLFAAFGTTEEDVVLPRDRRTRRKKGFAYIIVSDRAAADSAIATFDGFEIDGKALSVRIADATPVKGRRPARRL